VSETSLQPATRLVALSTIYGGERSLRRANKPTIVSEQCRHRHQKCRLEIVTSGVRLLTNVVGDTTSPTCGPCASSGRTCTRGLLFKAYKCKLHSPGAWSDTYRYVGKFDKKQRFFRPPIDNSSV
jgi:hypothetical protein